MKLVNYILECCCKKGNGRDDSAEETVSLVPVLAADKVAAGDGGNLLRQRIGKIAFSASRPELDQRTFAEAVDQGRKAAEAVRVTSKE